MRTSVKFTILKNDDDEDVLKQVHGKVLVMDQADEITRQSHLNCSQELVKSRPVSRLCL